MNSENILNKIEDFALELFDGSMSTYTNNVAGQDLTLETILEAKKLIENIKDPFAELMKDKGYDPEKGDILVWPKHMLNIFGGLPIPSYVRVTELIDVPHCVKGLSRDINDLKMSIKI